MNVTLGSGYFVTYCYEIPTPIVQKAFKHKNSEGVGVA